MTRAIGKTAIRSRDVALAQRHSRLRHDTHSFGVWTRTWRAATIARPVRKLSCPYMRMNNGGNSDPRCTPREGPSPQWESSSLEPFQRNQLRPFAGDSDFPRMAEVANASFAADGIAMVRTADVMRADYAAMSSRWSCGLCTRKSSPA